MGIIRIAALVAALLVAGWTVPASAAAAAPSACAMPAGSVEGPIDPDGALRAIGTLRAVMLFVDFPDARANGSTDAYGDLFAPARAWFGRASYGRLTLRITRVDRWFRMPRASTEYHWSRDLTFAQQKAYVRDAVAAANPSVDFRGYDLLYIVPVRKAWAIDFSPAFVAGSYGIRADGNLIGFGATFGQDMWLPGWGSRLLDHETGHTLGLPDLYAFRYDPDDYYDQYRFAGGWDVMSAIDGPAPDPLAWHRRLLGWVTDAQVRCLEAAGSATWRLSPVESPGGVKLGIVRTADLRAFAVEVRAAVGNDTGVCRPGVLIYRVDGGRASGAGPIRVQTAHADHPSLIETCLPLHAATYAVGERFTSDRVTIEVLAHPGDDYRVRVTLS